MNNNYRNGRIMIFIILKINLVMLLTLSALIGRSAGSPQELQRNAPIKKLYYFSNLNSEEKESLPIDKNKIIDNTEHKIIVRDSEGNIENTIMITNEIFPGRNRNRLSPDNNKIATPIIDRYTKSTKLTITDLSDKDNPVIKDLSEQSGPIDMWDARWSYDSNNLAFRGKDEYNIPSVYITSLYDDEIVRVSPAQEGCGSPRWSRGGDYLFFLKYDNTRMLVLDIMRYKLGTGEVVQLTDGMYISSYYPSPDGEKVALIAYYINDQSILSENHQSNTAGLFIYDIINDVFIELERGDGDIIGKSTPSWSPDGTMMVYCNNQGAEGTSETHFNSYIIHSDLFIVKSDGSDKINLTSSPYTIEVDPYWGDDKFIYCKQKSNPLSKSDEEILIELNFIEN